MIPVSAQPGTRRGIDRSIDEALARVQARANRHGECAEALAGAITRAAHGGKRFRPVLVVSAFEAFGGVPETQPALYPVAAAFELLHTAFVVHDDVIDHDVERRGLPNIAGEFRRRGRLAGADAAAAAALGDAAAILAGDLLLHEAERLVALADVPTDTRRALLDLLDDAVFVSVAGELADVENAIAADAADADAIIAAAHDKTAVYSFTAPLRAGALLAGAGALAAEALDRFGGRLGLAYQLVDDLIGAFGSTAQAGRAPGGDLREAKRTPLVALARESTQWSRVSDALAIAHTGPIAVQEAQRALDDSGARVRLVALVDETLEDARAGVAAARLPAAAAELLSDLADAVEARIP